MKKKDLVNETARLKGKVIVDNNIKNPCDQLSRLSKNLAKLMESNENLVASLSLEKRLILCLKNV